MSQTPSPDPQSAGTLRGDFWPAPGYNNDSGEATPLSFDSAGNLAIRGPVTTDEASFRDDFTGSSIEALLTGTLTFTTGSTTVTGTGTNFTTEPDLDSDGHLRSSADAITTYIGIASIDSDTQMTLDAPYAGTTQTTTGYYSHWQRIASSGATVTVGSSYVSLDSGSSSGARAQITRLVDFLPLISNVIADINTRVTGEESYFGYQDAELSPQARVQVLFDGDDPFKAKFITASSSATADTQTTTFTLPGGATTDERTRWRVELLSEVASVYCNDQLVAQHRDHLPDPYRVLYFVAGTLNTVAVAASVILHIDLVTIVNTDVLQIGSAFSGAPVTVAAPSLLDQALNQMNLALQQIRDRQGYPDGAGRGRVAIDTITTGLTLSTVTTVGTVTTVTGVTTVSTVSNVASVGGLFANYDQVAAWNNVVAANRGRITVA